MKRNIEIIAYHGWGMSADFWKQWPELLGDHITFKAADRGYFAEPADHQFEDKEAVHVLFVQGFGIHWVSKENWKNAHLIVLFSTFNEFENVITKGRNAEHIIETMKGQIDRHVYFTMDLFWEELFKSDDSFLKVDDYDIRDRDLLKNDLDSYMDKLVKKVPVNSRAKILLYETDYDDIMNHTQARSMKDVFGRLDYYHCFDILGHGYPFTHAEDCYKDLSDHLSIF